MHAVVDMHTNIGSRTIYDEVIAKICRWLVHPTLIDPIKACLQPFMPEVILNLVTWTMYPVTCLIETLWTQHKGHLQVGKQLDCYNIKFMSILERSLNYVHTGSGKVISHKLMLPTFLFFGILHDRFPYVNKHFILFTLLLNQKQIIITSEHWPYSPMRYPLIGSLQVQESTYDKAHAQVQTPFFMLCDNLSYSAKSHTHNNDHKQFDRHTRLNSLSKML